MEPKATVESLSQGHSGVTSTLPGHPTPHIHMSPQELSAIHPPPHVSLRAVKDHQGREGLLHRGITAIPTAAVGREAGEH